MTGKESRRRMAKRAALTSGLILVAVSAFHWRDLAREVHLLRLRADPRLIDRLAVHPQGTPAADAVGRFVRTLEGKRALRQALVRAVISRGGSAKPVDAEIIREPSGTVSLIRPGRYDDRIANFTSEDREPLFFLGQLLGEIGEFSPAGELTVDEPLSGGRTIRLEGFRDAVGDGEWRVSLRLSEL